jgi:NAD(P)-dependent dehydrogenase (short-subunit alcohol dehydrogenase family)
MSKSVAIITGASQGIGQATAVRLSRDLGWAGCDLVTLHSRLNF